MSSALLVAVVSLLAVAAGSVVKTNQVQPEGTFELLILHNNDMHARFEQTSQLSGACTTADRDAGKCYGGFPRVAYLVKKAREEAASGQGPPVLYLNAGDTYTGTAWFTIYKWKIAAEFVNALQPDAVSLGNHEFDEAVDGVIPFIHNLSAPVLAANLVLDKTPRLRDEPNLRSSVVLSKNGVKIGVIGYLTPETKFLAPRNDVGYEEEVTAIRREVTKLQAQNVNILIALGHSGFIKDLQIAKEVDGIDLVIGGHSNTFLWNGNETDEKPEYPQGHYPTLVQQDSGRVVPVVQAYAYTKYLGKIHLTFDASGEIIHMDGQPILLDQQHPRDPEVLELVRKYRASIALVNEEVIGTSLNMIDGGQCRLRECTMGNIITDAILEYSKNHQQEIDSCFNIAIVQGGRIRASIEHPQKPFNITRGDLLTVLPFSDTLSIVTMNGSVLLRMLEHSVDTWRRVDSTGQFLQFSGMQVVYDLSKNPGSRVVSAKAISSHCGDTQLVDIKDATEYKLIMPSFISDGGDGYELFRNLPTEPVTFNEVVCVIEYMSKHSPLNPTVTNRLIVLNEDKAFVRERSLKSKAVSSYAFSKISHIGLSFIICFIGLSR